MGQTVNLLAYAFGGSNPSSPTISSLNYCGSSSVDRASAFQAEGREFEPRLPLKISKEIWRFFCTKFRGLYLIKQLTFNILYEIYHRERFE